MQMQMSLKKKDDLENKLDAKEKNHETFICTPTADRMGTSSIDQQNHVIMNQPARVEKNCDNDNQEINEMLDKEDEVTILHCKYVYELRKKKTRTSNVSQVYKRSELDKGKRQVQAPSFFSQVTSRNEAYLGGHQRDMQISLPTVSLVETVSTKSSSQLKAKKKGHSRNSQALPGSSSRSVPKKRNRKSGIEEIEDAELNSRRWTYLSGKYEKIPSIFDDAPKHFYLVDAHMDYKESLLKFAKNLGPTAQIVASKMLEPLSSAQATTHEFQAPVPHPSSAQKLFDDPKGKSVIMDRGSGKNKVSTGDERPMGLFDRVGTLSAGRDNIASFPDASKIQRSTDVVHRAVREHVHRPTHNHSQLVLQQQHRPPSNAAVANAYTVRATNQVPIAYEARPRQNSYPSPTFRPSRLSAMCHALGVGYGVGGGHQSTPLNELQWHANPAALRQGFQQTFLNSHMQLQNQLGSEARRLQKQMRLEQQPQPQPQPLPLLSNMFGAGTSHAGTSSTAENHQTISNTTRSGQELPLAHRSNLNLELQLRTKPLSSDEAS